MLASALSTVYNDKRVPHSDLYVVLDFITHHTYHAERFLDSHGLAEGKRHIMKLPYM